MRKTEPRIPSPILDGAEKFQNIRGNFVRKIIDFVAGSDYRDYYQLDWHSRVAVREAEGAIRPWALSSGDPDAGRFLPRPHSIGPIEVVKGWNKAIVLTAGRRALDHVRAEVPDPDDALDAVAYNSDGLARVGILPEGVSFGTIDSELQLEAIAMRPGRGAAKLSMGIWSPKDRAFWTPRFVDIHDTVAIADLPGAYPGMPLA